MPEIPIFTASPVQLPLKTLNSDIFFFFVQRISIKIHRQLLVKGGVAVILYIKKKHTELPRQRHAHENSSDKHVIICTRLATTPII